jgi:hypothetical protein
MGKASNPSIWGRGLWVGRGEKRRGEEKGGGKIVEHWIEHLLLNGMQAMQSPC